MLTGKTRRVPKTLTNGSPLNQANDSGDSALLLAAHGGHRHLVEYLVQRGARLTDCNKHGITPLMSASRGGQIEMVQWLLEQGASIEEDCANDEHGRSGYNCVNLAIIGGHHQLVRFFLDRERAAKEEPAFGEEVIVISASSRPKGARSASGDGGRATKRARHTADSPMPSMIQIHSNRSAFTRVD
jgi:hypothetical protein